jgi:hypothetical protein
MTFEQIILPELLWIVLESLAVPDLYRASAVNRRWRYLLLDERSLRLWTLAYSRLCQAPRFSCRLSVTELRHRCKIAFQLLQSGTLSLNTLPTKLSHPRSGHSLAKLEDNSQRFLLLGGTPTAYIEILELPNSYNSCSTQSCELETFNWLSVNSVIGSNIWCIDSGFMVKVPKSSLIPAETFPHPDGIFYGHVSIAFANRYIIIHGGRKDSTLMESSKASMFDTLTQVWHNVSFVGDFPSPRYCHSAVVTRDDNNSLEAYVFGGWDPIRKEFFNSLHRMDCHFERDGDPSSLRCCWTALHPFGILPGIRCQAVWEFIKPKDGLILLLGGALQNIFRDEHGQIIRKLYGDTVVDLDDAFIFDTVTCSWIPVPDRFFNIRGGCNGTACLSEGNILITGGMHSNPGCDHAEYHDSIGVLSLSLTE